MTRLPVTWAVNRPPSPRKPMASTLPAVKLSTAGSSFMVSEESTDDVKTRALMFYPLASLKGIR
jgi:hypothetical protein